MIKILKGKNIITCGNGDSRMVLDYDANVIYQYHDMCDIKAVYEQGQWHLTERPDSSRGGWGTYSSGNINGDSKHSNAIELLRAINAKATVYNIPAFFDEQEYQVYLKTLTKVERINKTAKILKIGHNFNTTFIKIKGKSIYSNYSPNIGKSKGLNPLTTIEKMTKACEVFLTRKGKTVKLTDYTISTNIIKQGKTIVAFYDTQGQLFMNSQVLTITNFEHAFLGGQSIIQDTIRPKATYNIPFNVLESANLLLNETNVLDTGPTSTHTLNSGQTRHFTGALLLENAGRKFLMDLDQIEIKNKLFNVFFVEVSEDVNTINEAYVSMKPDSVKRAESVGTEVKRQGEWFFIKTDKTIQLVKDDILTWAREDKQGPRLESFDIAHGKGRPNSLYKPLGFDTEYNDLVCGMVTHSGREHAPLSLGVFDGSKELNAMPPYSADKTKLFTFNLWQVVPNTTIGNFTITGDVD